MKFFIFLCFFSIFLFAQDKVALVIGNKAYKNQTELNNPINDAKLIKKTLESIGFEVTPAYDKNLNELSDILDEFIAKAKRAKIAVVYYAGHGIGVGSKNYLIPIGASNLSVDNLPRKLISVDELKGAVAQAKKFGVVLFDACRNSFFSERISGLGNGRGSRALVRPTIKRDQNILVSFSTKAGTIAKDDVNGGKHSPYALALNRNLIVKDDIRLVMGGVKESVESLTKYQQEPIYEASLGRDKFCLAGCNRVENGNTIIKPQVTHNSKPTNKVSKGKWNPKIYRGERSYSKNSAHTVKDNYTGLIWQQEGSSNKMNWQEAKRYCANLSLDGYSDWRLPSQKELYYLADRKKHPAIDNNYFNIKSYYYWSSKEYLSFGCYVNFSNGFDAHCVSKRLKYYALCARGGE